MEYKEFVKQRKRMCKSQNRCDSSCGLYKFELCQVACLNPENLDEVEQIVEEWAEEHSDYIKAGKFKERYKNMPW